MLTDALGYPLKFILTGGERHDITQAESLLNNVSGQYVIADKAYDKEEFIKTIESHQQESHNK